MTDIEKLKHQRKVLDEQIEAAERRELATQLRDTMRALTDNRDLPVEKIIRTVLRTWKDQPDARHTATEFLEILATTVNAYPAAPLNGQTNRLRDGMLENHRLDDRMRIIEQGFARIDQRLDTLERAFIPSADIMLPDES